MKHGLSINFYYFFYYFFDLSFTYWAYFYYIPHSVFTKAYKNPPKANQKKRRKILSTTFKKCEFYFS